MSITMGMGMDSWAWTHGHGLMKANFELGYMY
jgi:hypothetical protein